MRRTFIHIKDINNTTQNIVSIEESKFNINCYNMGYKYRIDKIIIDTSKYHFIKMDSPSINEIHYIALPNSKFFEVWVAYTTYQDPYCSWGDNSTQVPINNKQTCSLYPNQPFFCATNGEDYQYTSQSDTVCTSLQPAGCPTILSDETLPKKNINIISIFSAQFFQIKRDLKFPGVDYSGIRTSLKGPSLAPQNSLPDNLINKIKFYRNKNTKFTLTFDQLEKIEIDDLVANRRTLTVWLTLFVYELSSLSENGIVGINFDIEGKAINQTNWIIFLYELLLLLEDKQIFVSIIVEEFWYFFNKTHIKNQSLYVFNNLKSIIWMHYDYDMISPNLEQVLDYNIQYMESNLNLKSADIKNKLIYGIKPGGCGRQNNLNFLKTKTYIKELQSFIEPIKGFYLWNINRDFGCGEDSFPQNGRDDEPHECETSCSICNSNTKIGFGGFTNEKQWAFLNSIIDLPKCHSINSVTTDQWCINNCYHNPPYCPSLYCANCD